MASTIWTSELESAIRALEPYERDEKVKLVIEGKINLAIQRKQSLDLFKYYLSFFTQDELGELMKSDAEVRYAHVLECEKMFFRICERRSAQHIEHILEHVSANDREALLEDTNNLHQGPLFLTYGEPNKWRSILSYIPAKDKDRHILALEAAGRSLLDIRNMSYESVELLLCNLSSDRLRSQLIMQRDSENCTCISYIDNPEALKLIFNHLTEDERISLITSTDFGSSHSHKRNLLLEFLPKDHKFRRNFVLHQKKPDSLRTKALDHLEDILSESCEVMNFDNIFEDVNCELIEVEIPESPSNKILENLDESDRRRLVLSKDSRGDTLLHKYMHNRCSCYRVQMLLNCIPAEDLKDYIMTTNSQGRTALHLACAEFSSRVLLDAMPVEYVEELIYKQDNDGITALMINVQRSVLLLNRLSSESQQKLIMLPSNSGMTAIHLACERQNEDQALLLFNKLSEEKKMEALLMKDKAGNTPLLIILKKHSKNTMKLLQAFLPMVTIDDLIETREKISQIKFCYMFENPMVVRKYLTLIPNSSRYQFDFLKSSSSKTLIPSSANTLSMVREVILKLNDHEKRTLVRENLRLNPLAFEACSADVLEYQFQLLPQSVLAEILLEDMDSVPLLSHVMLKVRMTPDDLLISQLKTWDGETQCHVMESVFLAATREPCNSKTIPYVGTLLYAYNKFSKDGFLSSLMPAVLQKLLTERKYYGKGIFNFWFMSEETRRLIFSMVPMVARQELMKFVLFDSWFYGAEVPQFENGRVNSLMELLKELPEEERAQILTTVNNKGETLLMRQASRCNSLLWQLPTYAEARCDMNEFLLHSDFDYNHTVIHRLCLKENEDIHNRNEISAVLSYLTEPKKDELLFKQSKAGETALFLAYDSTTAAMLIDSVSSNKRQEYIRTVDGNGNTAIMRRLILKRERLEHDDNNSYWHCFISNRYYNRIFKEVTARADDSTLRYLMTLRNEDGKNIEQLLDELEVALRPKVAEFLLGNCPCRHMIAEIKAQLESSKA